MAQVKKGRPRKLDDHQALIVRIPRRLHTLLRHYALGQSSSLNDLMISIIQSWWEERPDRKTYERLLALAKPATKG